MSGQVIGNEYRLVDMDWKIVVVSDAKQKKEANEFKIDVKLVLKDKSGGVSHKFLEYSPIQFFEFYKEMNDIKNLIDMST